MLSAADVAGFRAALADVAGIVPDGHGKGDMLPSLPADLTVTFARQDQLTDPRNYGAVSREVPLVFKAHAGEALWVLYQTLSTWADTLGYSRTERSPAYLARWFLRNLDLVRKSSDAVQLVDEITNAIHQARRAIDRPEDRRLFLGPCGGRVRHASGTMVCKEELYGLPGNTHAVCQTCGAEYVISTRQEELRTRAQQYVGTAPKVAGFLRATGLDCSAEMIRGYAHRGRLKSVGANKLGHPEYAIGDVLDALRNRYVRRKTDVCYRQNQPPKGKTNTKRNNVSEPASTEAITYPTKSTAANNRPLTTNSIPTIPASHHASTGLKVQRS